MENKILVTRAVDCSSITKEEFIRMMIKDLEEAIKVYDEYWCPIYEESHRKAMENYRKSVLKVSTEFAEKKWKTEKRRQQYIDKKLSEIEDNGYYYPCLTFFDMDLEPGKNGISGACVIDVKNPNLDRCWEEIKDNKYFIRATGWILEDHHGFRPQIKLILSEDVQEEFDNERKDLERAIAEFYRGTTYFGD